MATDSSTATTGTDAGNAPADVPTGKLRRPAYFDGQFLRAAQLTAEQSYVSTVLLQMQLAEGLGVAFGLSVSSADGTVKVTPGVGFVSGGMVYVPEPIGGSISTLVGQGVTTVVTSPPEMYEVLLSPRRSEHGDDLVYGLKCAEDCSSPTTSVSYTLEGVALTMVPFSPASPLQGIAPDTLGSKWLRSRAASAHFRGLDRATSSRSASGLRDDVWCRGNPLEQLAALPVGVVFDIGELVCDPWIVRRERIDSPAEAIWARRMGMRPRRMFLAQLLQFQCQLVDALGGLYDTIEDIADAEADALVREIAEAGGNPREIIRNRMLSRFGRRRGAEQALTGSSVLHDLGFVELPSAGLIPIALGTSEPLVAQIERWFGIGEGGTADVDLEFVGVRDAEIGRVIDDARHLERIPLWSPVDDPNPKVTIYVPDGVQQKAPAPSSPNLYSGWVDLGVVPEAIEGADSMEDGAHLRLASLVRFEADATRAGRFVLLGVGCRPREGASLPFIAELRDVLTGAEAAPEPQDPGLLSELTSGLDDATLARLLVYLQEGSSEGSFADDVLAGISLVAVWIALDVQPAQTSTPPKVAAAEVRFFEFPAASDAAPTTFDSISATLVDLPVQVDEAGGAATISARWRGFTGAPPAKDGSLERVAVSADLDAAGALQAVIDNIRVSASRASGALSLNARVQDSAPGVFGLRTSEPMTRRATLPVDVEPETLLDLLGLVNDGSSPASGQAAAFVERAGRLLRSTATGPAAPPDIWTTTASYVAFARSPSERAATGATDS